MLEKATIVAFFFVPEGNIKYTAKSL